MNTKLGLIEAQLADHIRIVEMAWWQQGLMLVGAFTLLVLFFAGFLYLVTRDDPEPQDIPDFVVCTCPVASMPTYENFSDGSTVLGDPMMSRITNPKCSVHGLNAAKHNHTSTLSVSEMRSVPTDPKRGA